MAGAQQTDIAQVIGERDEALEQQAAISDILQVISNSPGDVQPVLDMVAERAAHICEAHVIDIAIVDKEMVRIAASFGQFEGPALPESIPLDRFTVTGRAICDLRPIHVADLQNAGDEFPLGREIAIRYRHRTILSVPLIREGRALGSIVARRAEVRPFGPKHISLLTAFAAQAAIAIENVRLLNELRQSLEQQTATSEVLQVISSATGDLKPVFAAMLAKAVRICGATFGTIYLCDEGKLLLTAAHNVPPAFEEARADRPFTPAPGGIFDTVIKTGKTVHLSDLAATKPYAERHPRVVEAVELGGIRTLAAVPMFKERELVGIINIHRREVRPFTDEHIALVTNFAAQAVIAIENARLLNELRQRTTDLSERTTSLCEALEQQTATSEVLQVISGSPGDLPSVFAAMLEKAVHICDAKFGSLFLYEKGAVRLVAGHNVPEFLAARGSSSFLPAPGAALDLAIRTKRPFHSPDLAASSSYAERHPRTVEAVEIGGIRTVVAVPMLKDDEPIGVIAINRREVRPFTDKQIELVKNFAAQAVIAIENARLLNELRQSTTDLTERTTDLTEALEQQTATSEVLQVISSSPGDLQPVFVTMVENAVRICHAKWGNIHQWEGEALHLVASYNLPPAFAAFRISSPVYPPHPKALFGQLLATKTVTQIIDCAAVEAYTERLDPVHVAAVELGGTRTALAVPMLKDNKLIGAFALIRQEVLPFTDKQIELVKNFAAQAVIAIENARLLNELRERTAEVENLNQQLEQRVADQVGEIERMGRLRRFLPPQVADLIVASGTEKQLESHRREITALFCDLRGFTGFTESADAEDVMALLREYHAAIGEIVIKYSGTLERYAGDGVMVIFNDPVPIENPALQAVLMALEMREAIGALTETWRRWGHDIGFGIGIAHGFATLGTIGFEGRFDYAAIGTVSNVASRLCDEAKPGQILISPRVLTKVENAVKVEPVGEFELKGIRRPLAAYNVLAALA